MLIFYLLNIITHYLINYQFCSIIQLIINKLYLKFSKSDHEYKTREINNYFKLVHIYIYNQTYLYIYVTKYSIYKFI